MGRMVTNIGLPTTEGIVLVSVQQMMTLFGASGRQDMGLFTIKLEQSA